MQYQTNTKTDTRLNQNRLPKQMQRPMSTITVRATVSAITKKKFTKHRVSNNSKINHINFSILCLVLQDTHPNVTPLWIIKSALAFIKEIGDCTRFLSNSVFTIIERKIETLQQTDSNLSYEQCERIAIFAFLSDVIHLTE